MSRTVRVVIELKGQSKVEKQFDQVRAKQKLAQEATKAQNIEYGRQKRLEASLAISKAKLSHAQSGLTKSFLLGNLAARAITAAVNGFFGSLRFATTGVIDFEFAMAKSQAIIGITGVQLKSLEDSIRGIASSSPRTAAEVANTALSMSKLGLASHEVENALEGVIGLSVALDEDVNRVGETMVAVKNVFGLSASELTEVSDKLFTAFGSSALNLEKFSTAFSFAGATANLAGVSFEQTAAVMGLLSDAGIKASTIGTQLRKVFTELDDSGSKASQAIGGETIKTIGLSEALRRLRPIITDAGKAKELFGRTASSVITVLTRNVDKIDELTGSITDMEKTTEDAAKTMNDTFLGQIKRLQSEFLNLAIAISKSHGWIKGAFGFLSDYLSDAGKAMDKYSKQREVFEKEFGRPMSTSTADLKEANRLLDELAVKNQKIEGGLLPPGLGPSQLSSQPGVEAEDPEAVSLKEQADEAERAAKAVERANKAKEESIKALIGSYQELKVKADLAELGRGPEVDNLIVKYEQLGIKLQELGQDGKALQIFQEIRSIQTKIAEERKKILKSSKKN